MSLPSTLARRVSAVVLRLSGVVVDESKLERAEDNLHRLATQRGLCGSRELLREVEGDPSTELIEQFLALFLVHETSFFRDAASPFVALEEEILPELIERRCGVRRLRIWCAAASSGQEPYSLAMVLAERFPRLTDWCVDFRAGDLSPRMIERCREGVYRVDEVNRGLSAERLVRFFHQEGTGYQVNDSLRRRIHFEQRNLLDPWDDLPLQDVILMRNVLIYFDTETKRELLNRALGQLAPDGCLFLGGSEAPMFYTSGFAARRRGRSVWFVRRNRGTTEAA